MHGHDTPLKMSSVCVGINQKTMQMRHCDSIARLGVGIEVFVHTRNCKMQDNGNRTLIHITINNSSVRFESVKIEPFKNFET